MKELRVNENGSESVPYNVPGIPVYAGSGMLSLLPQMSCLHHWHEDMEFAWVQKGHVTYDVNNMTMTICEGDGLFINSSLLHRNYSRDGSDAEYRCALIHPSLLIGSLPDSSKHVISLMNNAAYPYRVLRRGAPKDEEILRELNRYFELATGDLRNNILGIQACAFRITHLLLSDMPLAVTPKSTGFGISSLRNMVGYVQLHYAEKIDVEDIARAGNVGKRLCYELFEKLMHTSPKKYVNNYRLGMAAMFIAETGMSMAQIAASTGFESAGYFSEKFKEEYNMTPLEYRRSRQLDRLPGNGRDEKPAQAQTEE